MILRLSTANEDGHPTTGAQLVGAALCGRPTLGAPTRGRPYGCRGSRNLHRRHEDTKEKRALEYRFQPVLSSAAKWRNGLSDNHAVTEPGLAHHFDSMDQQREAGTLGMWVFLITEIMFFGGLFLAYILFRSQFSHEFAVASR